MAGQLRLIRRQLAIFAVVALVALLVVGLSYLQVPRLLGIGQMPVTATLPETGGLAANALVTYRGQQVGKVKDVRLAPTGVVAELSLDRGANLPADVRGQVHSASVIGEQYLELLPTGDPRAAGNGSVGTLRPGAVIPATKDQPVPVAAGTLLQTLDSLITSIDADHLRTTVDEVGTAFKGTEGPLTSLLDGSHALVADAQANLGATRQLIDNLAPVLETQLAVGPQTEQLAADLNAVTGRLKLSDGDVRALINQTPAVAAQLSATVTALHPLLPQVLANLAATGEVLTIYDAGTRQILTIYPALVATLQATSVSADVPGRGNLWFHLNINDPGPCREGFTGKPRSYNDLSPSPTVNNGWCKLPADSQISVRGSRNHPCPNGSARSATAAGCGLDFRDRISTTLTAYDPATGDFVGPGGKRYRIDLDANGRGGTSPYASGLLRALSSR
jgi:phospholipid/cholesterol/gamma-HCH transport system substrate-binding protein